MTTQTTKHTPGPWKVNANVGKRGELGIVADAAPCVIAHGMSEKHWPEIAQANAALIAAAPEMLTALQTCLEYFESVPECEITPSEEAYLAATKAAQKATGEI